jgi:hypothetical protein
MLLQSKSFFCRKFHVTQLAIKYLSIGTKHFFTKLLNRADGSQYKIFGPPGACSAISQSHVPFFLVKLFVQEGLSRDLSPPPFPSSPFFRQPSVDFKFHLFPVWQLR